MKCPTHGKVHLKRLRYAGITLRQCCHTFVRKRQRPGHGGAAHPDITGHDASFTFDLRVLDGNVTCWAFETQLR